MLSGLRFALRSFAKFPGFTLIAALTLAVGIGAATAMYSALRVLVVEPFSYPHPDRVIELWSNYGQPLSTPDYFDFRDQATSFAELGAYSPRAANLGGEKAQSMTAVDCTSGVLRAMGVAPALGRWLGPADEDKGAPPVAIISDGLWKQSFGGDPGIVGRTIRLDGAEASVVGVMPAGFEFASPWLRSAACQVWTPLKISRGDGERGRRDRGGDPGLLASRLARGKGRPDRRAAGGLSHPCRTTWPAGARPGLSVAAEGRETRRTCSAASP
jgi:putative ABC transport system permease protein